MKRLIAQIEHFWRFPASPGDAWVASVPGRWPALGGVTASGLAVPRASRVDVPAVLPGGGCWRLLIRAPAFSGRGRRCACGAAGSGWRAVS